MTERRSRTLLLVIAVFVVAYAALVISPPQTVPEEGRVLALLRIEDAGPGFSNTTTFDVTEDYERIGLSYVITQASYVRAHVTAPNGTRHDAQPLQSEEGDRLMLNVMDPDHGAWSFTVRTLDETGREGRIEQGDFFILGFGGDRR